MSAAFEAVPLAQAVGWALLHSAWQLLVVAALLWGTLAVARNASAVTRYWTSVAALMLGVALPILTAIAALARIGARGASGDGLATALPWVSWLPAQVPAAESSANLSLAERASALAPTLTVVWLVAVMVLSVRLALGWRRARRLRTLGTRRLPVRLTRGFYRVARELGVRGVRFLESRAVDVPMVVGWLSPVVLIPAAAMLRLAPHELESVVAHELAHVRRRDYLVNLIQTVVETAFFFHPAVWWISNRIRQERECCCDDTAVSACGDALAYARALTELESLRGGLPRLAMGATGGVLLERVRRLVQPGGGASDERRSLGGLVVLLSSSALLFGTSLSIGAPSEATERTGSNKGLMTHERREVEFIVRAAFSDDETELEEYELVGEDGEPVRGRFVLRLEPDELALGSFEQHTLLANGEHSVLEVDHQIAVRVEDQAFLHGLVGEEAQGELPDFLRDLDHEHFPISDDDHLGAYVMVREVDESTVRGEWSTSRTVDLLGAGSLQIEAELTGADPEALRAELLEALAAEGIDLDGDARPRQMFVFKTAMLRKDEVEDSHMAPVADEAEQNP